MYLSHFGLQRKPFTLMPDPDFLHLSSQHKVAYSLLEYGIFEQTGISVLTGEIGSGKTTLLRKLLQQLAQTHITVGLIDNTHESLGNLTTWIALAFDIDIKDKSRGELYQDIQSFVIKQYGKGKRTLLIVDEAQNLSISSLEELRLFTNINTGEDFLMQILLIGQPGLCKLLADPELEQLAQRVSVEYHLNPLNLKDTMAYVRHRIEIAKGEHELFSDDALKAVYYFSGGIPRLINSLCDYALVYSYGEDKKRVDLESILKSADGRKIGGVNRFSKANKELEVLKSDIFQTGNSLLTNHVTNQ